jgi:hypothetical protein
MKDEEILENTFSFSDFPITCNKCEEPKRMLNKHGVCRDCREKLLLTKAREGYVKLEDVLEIVGKYEECFEYYKSYNVLLDELNSLAQNQNKEVEK